MGENKIGIILSGSTTKEASCQLTKEGEGKITEGMLLLVKAREEILARVNQIKPFNAFYSEGDPFSEARRDDRPIPDNIARQYEVCSLDLLMVLPHKDIRYPPLPGNPVVKIDIQSIENYEEKLFGLSDIKRIEKGKYKGIIKMGTMAGYNNLPIPLDIEKIPMHIGIFGVTGSGKSFNTGHFIENLLNIPIKEGESKSYPIIIIDAHGDYIDYTQNKDVNKFSKTRWIKRFVFNKAMHSPTLGECTNIEPIGINLDMLPLGELAELIVTYYKGSVFGSELSVSGIENIFEHLKIGRASCRERV